MDIYGPIPGLDSNYLIEASLGTPPTKYNLWIDSGSSDLWLPGEACTNCTHRAIGPRSSKTFTASSERWVNDYAKGHAAGTLCADTISIAGYTLEHHAFGQPSLAPGVGGNRAVRDG